VRELIPEEYADFREPVADALLFFLENLPPARTAAILDELLASPDLDSVETQMIALARHCPTLQKLGQLLARDRRLSPEFRQLLQTLETMPPRTCSQRIAQVIHEDLDPLDDAGIAVADVAIAEASVAVVVPFTWRDAESQAPQRGVLKVLKPDVREHLAEELEILGRVGEYLDARCEHYGIPELDYADTFAQVNERLSHEVDLQQEQVNLQRAAQAYAADPDVIVPRVLPFCSSRITAMERIDGRKVTELCAATASERRRLASLIVEALIAEPVWSGAPSLFHADPHAGNLFRTANNKLALFDWSLTGTLTRADAIGVSQIMLAALTLDDRKMHEAIHGLTRRSVDESALQSVIADALRDARHAIVPGLAWLTRFLDEVVQRARVSFSTDLLMFRKVLLTLQGVLADVDANCNVDAILAVSFATRLTREWGARLLSPPCSRRFGTHLSNADLACVISSTPLTAFRYWTGWFNEWFCV
jgi:ubiquinone biosynthesis protein